MTKGTLIKNYHSLEQTVEAIGKFAQELKNHQYFLH